MSPISLKYITNKQTGVKTTAFSTSSSDVVFVFILYCVLCVLHQSFLLFVPSLSLSLLTCLCHFSLLSFSSRPPFPLVSPLWLRPERYSQQSAQILACIREPTAWPSLHSANGFPHSLAVVRLSVQPHRPAVRLQHPGAHHVHSRRRGGHREAQGTSSPALLAINAEQDDIILILGLINYDFKTFF